MRKLIAGMKVSLDLCTVGPNGFADWVDVWSEDYGLTQQIDACILGGGMYPGYEQYWTAVVNADDKPLPMTEKLATPDEIKWAKFAAKTPHHVLSKTLTTAQWTNTHFIRSFKDVAALKQKQGKDIYLIGGAQTTTSLIDAGLIDELRLIVYPLIAGGGKPLFAASEHRRVLTLLQAKQLSEGRVSLNYKLH
jgi:dihydrofolate reductase